MNLLTDVPGLRVGHAQDEKLASGVTCVLFDEPATASLSILGGAPGVRDGALLEADKSVEKVNGLMLSGGSAFGLDAMGGAQGFLREQGRGFRIAGVVVPIVPGAIIFDLTNGGDKDWGRRPPYWELGYEAAVAARPGPFGLGKIGVATDATLTKAECKRLAIMANDGLAKALRPVHAPNDGDTVFAVSTGRAGPAGEAPLLTELGTVAADCLARAVARGVYEATALPFAGAVPDWKTRFGGARR